MVKSIPWLLGRLVAIHMAMKGPFGVPHVHTKSATAVSYVILFIIIIYLKETAILISIEKRCCHDSKLKWMSSVIDVTARWTITIHSEAIQIEMGE